MVVVPVSSGSVRESQDLSEGFFLLKVFIFFVTLASVLVYSVNRNIREWS